MFEYEIPQIQTYGSVDIPTAQLVIRIRGPFQSVLMQDVSQWFGSAEHEHLPPISHTTGISHRTPQIRVLLPSLRRVGDVGLVSSFSFRPEHESRSDLDLICCGKKSQWPQSKACGNSQP